MNAGQLIKILSSVDEKTDVLFSIGYDLEEREDFLDSVPNADDLADLEARHAEVSEISKNKLRLDIHIFPQKGGKV